MNLDKERTFWHSERERVPRVRMTAGGRDYLMQWELISRITASNDLLEVSFDCEFGHVHISSATTLELFFQELQLERIFRIDGRRANIKINFP